MAQKVDVVLVTEDLRGKGPEYVFRDAGIILSRTNATTVAGAIASAMAQRAEGAGRNATSEQE